LTPQALAAQFIGANFLLLPIVACGSGKPTSVEAKAPAEDARALRAVASFWSITDRAERSLMGKFGRQIRTPRVFL
jgi:hypothetical protein